MCWGTLQGNLDEDDIGTDGGMGPFNRKPPSLNRPVPKSAEVCQSFPFSPEGLFMLHRLFFIGFPELEPRAF